MKIRPRQLVNHRTIQAVARHIGTVAKPEKIILFGSYASGHPRAESDVDLLVIMRSRKRSSERAAELSRLLEPRPFPVDLLVRTPREIRRRLARGDTFIREILHGGRVLYPRPA